MIFDYEADYLINSSAQEVIDEKIKKFKSSIKEFASKEKELEKKSLC